MTSPRHHEQVLKPATRRVLGPTRQNELLTYLRTHRTGHVSELSELLGASESTIRRDLDELQERGLVERVHGGAAITESGIEAALPARARTATEQKRRIGQAAAALIEDGSTVLISGGTTTLAVLPYLGGFSSLTIVTNGVQIAAGCADFPDIQVLVLGGELRRASMSLLGGQVAEALAQLQVDQVLMGAFGVDPVTGISGANLLETQTDRAVLGAAEDVVVLADSSKFFQRGPVRIAATSEIATLVTDSDAPAGTVRAFTEAGVEVVTC
jgi:DeoR/GlpR family transcriptional regulator of sugar metabolism